MITNFFLLLGYTIGRLILEIPPQVEVSTSAFVSALEWLLPVLNDWNKIFPIDTLFQLLAIALAVEAAILIFRFLTWIRPPASPFHPNF